MFQDYISDDECEKEPEEIVYPRLGFDIITQEKDVLVHKMPKCGHEMNKDSLYDYAHSTFMDSSNMYLKCPHSSKDDTMDTLCNTKWEYKNIINILQYENKNEWL